MFDLDFELDALLPKSVSGRRLLWAEAEAMDAEKRRIQIARFIEENDGADVNMLAQRFAVSPMTIRRDRKILAQQKRISPTHGGAMPLGFRYGEMPYAQKADANLEKKRAIARLAATLVDDDSCVVLDAGTTTLELAKLLLDRPLTVVTVDLRIALMLSQSSKVRVVTPGGEVDCEIQAQISSSAVEFLQSFNAQIAFVGSAVWDIHKGLTCSTTAKQKIKQTMLRQAERSFLIADSTKHGLCNPWTVAPLKVFDGVVTDDALPLRSRQEAAAAGIELHICDAVGPTAITPGAGE